MGLLRPAALFGCSSTALSVLVHIHNSAGAPRLMEAACAITYQMTASCSSVVTPVREHRNHAPTRVANAETWIACIQILADDAEVLLCCAQKENSTCLFWRGCQTQVAQHTFVTSRRSCSTRSRSSSYRRSCSTNQKEQQLLQELEKKNLQHMLCCTSHVEST